MSSFSHLSPLPLLITYHIIFHIAQLIKINQIFMRNRQTFCKLNWKEMYVQESKRGHYQKSPPSGGIGGRGTTLKEDVGCLTRFLSRRSGGTGTWRVRSNNNRYSGIPTPFCIHKHNLIVPSLRFLWNVKLKKGGKKASEWFMYGDRCLTLSWCS
jgi:hypothetical protein